jgi:hypothetical protein
VFKVVVIHTGPLLAKLLGALEGPLFGVHVQTR